MYLTVKQQLKHLSKEEYAILRDLSHTAKNLANEAIYNIRQYYFKEGKFLNYNSNYHQLKHSENYRKLNSNMAQQILRCVDGDFKSFFALLKKAKNGEYSYKDCKLPHYLPKDGYKTLMIGFVRVDGNRLQIPYSNSYKKSHKPIEIVIPPMLVGKTIKEIKIIPKSNARYFEIHYSYEVDVTQSNLNKQHALSLDFGVNNLMTAVTNKGKSFIIDGRKLKSINQWYNKQNANLQSLKDKQRYGKEPTKRQRAITKKRNQRVNDYISKAARMVINYCIANNIGTLVVGYGEQFQRNVNLGKVNNQTFVNIPYGLLAKKLTYLCELYGIAYVEQEESYTSKASFWDKDIIPVYEKDVETTYSFSGKRIHRGLYQTANGKTLNADINGALNILRKSNVVSLDTLYARGEVDTPIRIRVA